MIGCYILLRARCDWLILPRGCSLQGLSMPLQACPDPLVAPIGSSTIRYRTSRVLAHGARDSVYELQDERTGTKVAAKVIAKTHVQQALQQLQTEISVHQILQHQHIVKLLGSCQDQRNVYLLMELCTGATVQDVVTRQGPLAELQAAQVLAQVLPAVDYMHQQGIIHCNLQLSNLLLHSSGSVKLCDFSTAAQPGSGSGWQQSMRHTAGCCPPEVLAGSGLGVEVDIWALGVMLYTMLAGQPPFQAGLANADPATISGTQLIFPEKPLISQQARDLITALARPNPAERPSIADICSHPFMQRHVKQMSVLSGCSSPAARQPAGAANVAAAAGDGLLDLDLDAPAPAAAEPCRQTGTAASTSDSFTKSCEEPGASSTPVGSAAELLQGAQQQRQLEQMGEGSVHSQAAAQDAAGSAPGVANTSWRLPTDCLRSSWDGSCSSGSVSGGLLAAQVSLDSSGSANSSRSSSPESQQQQSMLVSPEQEQQEAAAMDSSWAGDQHCEQQHIDMQMRAGAGPSFSGWHGALLCSAPVQQQQAGQQMQQMHVHGTGSQPLPVLDPSRRLLLQQQAAADDAGGVCGVRTSSDGAGFSCSRASSGSVPDLPASLSNWGMGHADISSRQPTLSLSISGSGLLQHLLQPPQLPREAGMAADAAVAACSRVPMHGLVQAYASPEQQPGSRSRPALGPRAPPPTPVQVPHSPRPCSMYHAVSAAAAEQTAPAAAAAAAESSSNSSNVQMEPSPPPGASYTACASPKVNLLHRQLVSGGSGGSASSAALSASPAVSPPVHAARMHSHNVSSQTAGKAMSAYLGQAGQASIPAPLVAAATRAAAAAAGAGVPNKYVCRDISQRLHAEACSDALQPLGNGHDSWQGSWGQQQQQQDSQTAAAAEAAEAAAAGFQPSGSSGSIKPGSSHGRRDSAVAAAAAADAGLDDSAAYQQHAAAETKSAPLGRGMSPAPPGVPPSAAQQAVAGLRGVRRSNSSIPSSPCQSQAQQLLSTWTPTLRGAGRQPQPHFWTPVATGVRIMPDDFNSASSFQPGSPGAESLLRQMQGTGYGSSAGHMPAAVSVHDSSRVSVPAAQVLLDVVQAVDSSSVPSVGSMPKQRGKPRSFMQCQQQQVQLEQLGVVPIDEGDQLILCRSPSASDTLGDLGLPSSGRLSDPGAVRTARLLGLPGAGMPGKLLNQAAAAAIMGRHSDQGVVGAGAAFAAAAAAGVHAANVKTMAFGGLPKHSSQLHQSGPPPRPPLHHANSQQQEWPSTPKSQAYLQQHYCSSSGQQQVDLQQQQQLEWQQGKMHQSSSEQLQQQQQHPVPPKQIAPLCRSPCVMRTRASPAAAPGLLQSGHSHSYIFSPVLGQQVCRNSSSSSDLQQLLVRGPSDSQSSSAETPTPASTPLSSCGRLDGSLGQLPLSSVGSGHGSGPGSCRMSRSNSGHLAMLPSMLPRPAFEQPHIVAGFSREAPAAAAASSPASRSARAGQDCSSDMQQMQLGIQQQVSCELFQRIYRSVSTPAAYTRDAEDMPLSSTVSRSIGAAAAAATAAAGGGSQPMAPHPPGTILGAAGMLSPRSGMGLLIGGVQGSEVQASGVQGSGVQPCPPHSSQPPAPSPSVKARVAHGQHAQPQHGLLHTQGPYPWQQQQQQCGPASPSGSRRKSVSDVEQAVEFELALKPRASSSSQVQLRAAPQVETGEGNKGYTLGASHSWEAGKFALQLDTNMQLQAIDEGAGTAEGGDGSCSTPNMDWDAPSNQQHEQAAADADAAQCTHDAEPSQHAAGDASLASASAGVADQGKRAQNSLSVTSSSGSSQKSSLEAQPADSMKPAAAPPGAAACAVAAAQFEGCPGWPWPVIAAYAHYKGRLAYLMSSGIVGVVFEDSTHMMVRNSDRWACYHDPSSSVAAAVAPVLSAAAAAAGSPSACSPGGFGSNSSSSCSSVTSRQPRRSSDTGRSLGPAHRDQNVAEGSPVPRPAAAVPEPHSPGPAAAAAAAAAGGVDAPPGVTVFMLPLSGVGDSTSSGDQQQAGSSRGPAGEVPEHLAAKARCLRRFVGCLMHHRPYSASCQPDITRLPFPVACKHAAAAAAAAVKPGSTDLDGLLHARVPHLGRFVHREGCLHLKLTDGSTQLVFTGDNSVLLLDPQCSQLAYVTHSKLRKGSKSATGSPARASPAKQGPAGAAHVVVLPLDAAAAAPPDGRLLARATYAAKLVRALQLPASWIEASGGSPASTAASTAAAKAAAAVVS